MDDQEICHSFMLVGESHCVYVFMNQSIRLILSSAHNYDKLLIGDVSLTQFVFQCKMLRVYCDFEYGYKNSD